MRKVSIYSLPILDRSKTHIGQVNEGRRLINAAGEMSQFVNGDVVRYIAYIEFLSGDDSQPRGNHYHKNKTEYVYVASGKLRAIFLDLETGEEAECVVQSGDLIRHDAFLAHAYSALEHTHAIEYTSVEYDPEDTHPHPLDFSKRYRSIEKINGLKLQSSITE
jgi:hypothetical protein